MAAASKPSRRALLEGRAAGGFVEGLDLAAVRRHAPVHLEAAGMERRWLLDAQREEIRPLLRPDHEHVAEAPVRHQQHPRAATLEQGVGGERRPDAHGEGRQRRALLREARVRQQGVGCPSRWSPGLVSSFAVRRLPSGASAIRSVKVPP